MSPVRDQGPCLACTSFALVSRPRCMRWPRLREAGAGELVAATSSSVRTATRNLLAARRRAGGIGNTGGGSDAQGLPPPLACTPTNAGAGGGRRGNHQCGAAQGRQSSRVERSGVRGAADVGNSGEALASKSRVNARGATNCMCMAVAVAVYGCGCMCMAVCSLVGCLEWVSDMSGWAGRRVGRWVGGLIGG